MPCSSFSSPAFTEHLGVYVTLSKEDTAMQNLVEHKLAGETAHAVVSVTILVHNHGLPWWLRWESVWLQCRRPGLHPGSGRSPEKGMATHSSLLAWRILWTGAWWATVHGVTKSWTGLRTNTASAQLALRNHCLDLL